MHILRQSAKGTKVIDFDKLSRNEKGSRTRQIIEVLQKVLDIGDTPADRGKKTSATLFYGNQLWTQTYLNSLIYVTKFTLGIY